VAYTTAEAMLTQCLGRTVTMPRMTHVANRWPLASKPRYPGYTCLSRDLITPERN